MLRVHVSKNKVRSGSTKLEVDKSASPTRAWKRLLQRKGRSKVRKLLTAYSLKSDWLFVMGYPWGFDFVILLQT